MTDTAPGPPSVPGLGDLRKQPIDLLIKEVQARLGVALDESTMVRKRRSVGAGSERNTWVRIEARPRNKAAGQGQINDGIEASALLTGIAKPQWYRAVSWLDEPANVFWRADEMQLIAPSVGRPIGYPRHEPELSRDWWHTFNTSLNNLTRQHVTRIATPDTQPITQDLITATIERAFPGQVNTTITDQPWVPAHADLNWSNLTAPRCWILDWEDLGLAPRGLDAATLWTTSFLVPTLAEKVRHERRTDLDTRSGKLMALFCCAKALNDSQFATDAAYAPTKHHAASLVTDLRH